MLPLVDPTTASGPHSDVGFIISAVCAGVASIVGSVALIGRRKAQADPENSPVRLRERLTAEETHNREQDRRITDIEEEVRLLRVQQVADEQLMRRRR